MANKVYGYCRISTKQQSIERQVRNIEAAYPEAQIVKEAYTGTKIIGRKELEKILAAVKPGDTIVFDSVSRMSRNAVEGWQLYRDLFEKGVRLVFLKEHHIDTDTYRAAMEKQIGATIETGDADADELVNTITAAVSKYMLRLAERQIVIAFEQAQKEVDDLHQRTSEGMKTAALNGKQIGAVPGRKLVVKKAAAAKAKIREYSRDFDGSLSDVDCIKLIGIASNTYYKYKRELREELA